MIIHDEGLQDELKAILEVEPRLLTRFVYRVARGARTDISRAIRERYAVKAGAISKHIKISQAVMTSDTSAAAKITIAGRPMSLSSFGAVRGTKRGVSFTVMKGRKTVAQSAFMMKGLVTKRQGRPRLPVRVLTGPSPSQMSTQSNVEKMVGLSLKKRFDSEAKSLIQWKKR